MKMKFYLLSILVVFFTICTTKLTFSSEVSSFGIKDLGKLEKSIKLKKYDKMNELKKENTLKKIGELKSSFLELGSKEKMASRMLATSRLESRLRHKLGTMMQKTEKKQRLTISGKKCADTFEFKGQTYDDCTTSKTPDSIDAQREWCFISPDLVEEGKKDWDYCQPDENYDRVRKEDQKLKLDYTTQYVALLEKIKNQTSNLLTYINLSVHIQNSFQELDSQVEHMLKECQQTSAKLDMVIGEFAQTAQMENYGVKLGGAIGMVDVSLNSSFQSFLQMNLGYNEQENLESGAAGGGFPVPNFIKDVGLIIGELQSDSDEVVSRDEQDSHEQIAPWMQERRLSKAKNGAGMDNYEEDMPGDGLMGQYYDNIYFTGNPFQQKDLVVDFDFTGASPAPGINRENFSIRWAGYILAPHTGIFNFIIDSDGAFSFTIDDQLILSKNMNFILNLASGEGDASSSFLKTAIEEQNSSSNCPKCGNSMDIRLIGGNKYKVILSYVHTNSAMLKEVDPVYIKLLWKSDQFKLTPVSSLNMFAENVFDPIKISGITPEIGVVRKLLNNNLAFKDSRNYVITDIPKNFLGLNTLKLNKRYSRKNLSFEVNNPCIVYIAYLEPYDDPTPKDFQETNLIMNLHYIPTPPRTEYKKKKHRAKFSIPLKIKMKQFDAGKVFIPLDKSGVNKKSISMIVFVGFDAFNSTPVSCGGNEMLLSMPTGSHYISCYASSQDIANSRRCEDGLNGQMLDTSHGGSMWSTINEGEGAWIQVNFKDAYQISRIEFQDRNNTRHRVKAIRFDFSDGNHQIFFKQNNQERREFRIDSKVKSTFVKATYKQVWSSGNNGGAFKIYGYRCTKSTGIDESPESVGPSYVTGIKPKELKPIFDLNKQRPIILNCNDTLFSQKFTAHPLSIGGEVLVKCNDSCVTSDENLRIFGAKNVYSADSVICKAALHSEKLPTEGGGKLMLRLGQQFYNLPSETYAGITSFRKEFTKYTISFRKFTEEDDIILKEGNKVDLRNTSAEGFLPGSIRRINNSGGRISLSIAIEGESPDSALFDTYYPNPDILFPCGEFIKERDCNGSRRNMNLYKPVKWRFAPANAQINSGELIDSGGVFGSSGKAYGWNRDVMNRVLIREETNDPKLKTLALFPPSPASVVCGHNRGDVDCDEANWSVKTGPGQFNVKIGIGDPHSSTRVDIKINDVYIVREVELSKGEYQVFEASVLANNEFIVFKSVCTRGCEYQMSKMNMVEISPVADEASFAKLMSERRPPERYDACGKTTTGGRCFDTDPTNCLYNSPSDQGTHLCTGSLLLVGVDPKYRCTGQRNKYKCVRRFYHDRASCNEVCPKDCTANGLQEGNNIQNSFKFSCT